MTHSHDWTFMYIGMYENYDVHGGAWSEMTIPLGRTRILLEFGDFVILFVSI
eukprot:CAMPEP_0118683362 /NCGR_PEP_ID=MMETSP0800-20121206/5999_1 /TAXON_ID=210618 ORGANISM="Striatella unipunctata, Strain CCMP2910" /NCGR_SAMPLE_ID=MMETSP0800 /ASSEMBLY_ACC=CAM_ASM_000638 /LENGTH=51 /DNA_ID=CAMNT_0006579855 /DNA_START=600 /DNA_END=753 /DNA_ORIENTATION=-